MVGLVGLFAALAMAFLFFPVQSLVDTRFDPYFFGEMGKSIARGEGFLPFGTLIKRRAPLYPLVIGGVYFVFGEIPRLIQLLQCVFHAGTCLLAFDLGRRLFNPRAGAIAGLLCALHPMLLRYVPDLHLETQLTFLMTLLVWLSVRFHRQPTLGNGALVGAAAAAATLTKAVVLPYPGLLALGMVLSGLSARRRGENHRPPWAALAAMFVVMACLILPWTVRNFRTTGHLVPVSSGASDAFLRGFTFSRAEFALLRKPPYTEAENEVNAYFRDLCRKAGTDWEKEDWETDQILNREARRRLLAEPREVARKFVVGLFTFWYQLTSLRNSLLAFVLAAGAWALALVGWRRARRERLPVWLLLLPVLYLNILLAALLALGRYSVPILPALLVLSAYGLDALLPPRREPPA